MTELEGEPRDTISVPPFWHEPSVDQYPVGIVLRGRNYSVPRNWIVLAAFTRNAPSWLSLNLHCTYPDMRGVTVENLEIFKKGPREAREDWSKAVITIERARGDWSSRKTRIPDRYGIEIDEREARNTHFAKDRKTVWFNGDGSRIIAYDDYGGIIGWDDVLEIGGAFYLLRYGPTLVEHWRDIRTRANQTMASFLSS